LVVGKFGISANVVSKPDIKLPRTDAVAWGSIGHHQQVLPRVGVEAVRDPDIRQDR